MMCEGCAGAVKRVLGKMEGEDLEKFLLRCIELARRRDRLANERVSVRAGVSSYEVILPEKKVIVRGDAITPEAVVEKVAKTGKATELWKD